MWAWGRHDQLPDPRSGWWIEEFYRLVLGANGDVVAPAFGPGAEGDLSQRIPVNGGCHITPLRGTATPLNQLSRTSPTLLCGRKYGTTMRYTDNPSDRLSFSL
jgi:hypothetical protein